MKRPQAAPASQPRKQPKPQPAASAKQHGGGDDDDYDALPQPSADAPPPAKKAKKAIPGEGAAKPPKKAALERVELPSLPAEEQAAALYASYSATRGGSFLEAVAFAPEALLRLPPAPSLQGRLKAALPAWRDCLARPPPGAPPGAPAVLVVAGAALRVLDLIRQLPDFNAKCRVAKLFSKHIKVEEQAEQLGKGPVCIALGTPARLDRLLALGALDASHLQLVVLDCARDVKQRALLDIPETRGDWWALWHGHLAARVASGATKLALL